MIIDYQTLALISFSLSVLQTCCRRTFIARQHFASTVDGDIFCVLHSYLTFDRIFILREGRTTLVTSIFFL